MKTAKRELQDKGSSSGDDRLLAIYSACLANAAGLIEEAGLLLQAGHYARAYFLGLSAIEELGKSQIVADYYSGLASSTEFQAAFSDHRLKLAYVSRVLAGSAGEGTINYDSSAASPLVAERNKALYVALLPNLQPGAPTDAVTRPAAERVINAAINEFSFIQYADQLNAPHIGSNASFK